MPSLRPSIPTTSGHHFELPSPTRGGSYARCRMGGSAEATCSKPFGLSSRQSIAIDRGKLTDIRFNLECSCKVVM
jgi:hypothetical protein